jgi:uncharacterized protein with FMN-binding domain
VRRAAAAVLGTIAGTSLLLGAKLGTASPNALPVNDAAPAAEPAVSGPAPAPSTSGAAPAPATATHTAAPAGTTPAAGRTTAAATPAAPPPTTAAAGLKNGTFAGPGVRERYGTITVSVTVAGGRITDAAGSCACSGESQQISGNAFTRLRQETLTAQSATIATVSGATYTSGAYKSSLQAAIAAAHG